MATDWREAWSAALDELELSVEAAESLLHSDHQARGHPLPDRWRPPQGLGPLPLELKPRADAILARQIAVGHALARAMAGNRRQAALLDRVTDAQQGSRRPAYLDCAM